MNKHLLPIPKMNKVKVIYNFQVCRVYHDTRTRALYNTICSRISIREESYYLISGFEAIDDIPLLRLTDNDDYLSAIDKLLQCFLYHERNNTDFDFFFFGDDDTFINFKNFDFLLKGLSFDELAVYGNLQRMFRFHSLGDDIHITGGPGILMNRRTFFAVTEAIRLYYVKDTKYSDVSLALNIKKYNRHAQERIKLLPVEHFIQDHKWMHEALPLLSEQYPEVVTYHLKSWLDGKNSYRDVLDIYSRLSVYDYPC